MNYTDTAQIATWYAHSLEAYRSDRFDGFTLQPKDGGIIASQAGYWGFLTVEPVEGAQQAEEGGVPTGLIVTGVIVALVIAGAVIFVLVRRRKMADVE